MKNKYHKRHHVKRPERDRAVFQVLRAIRGHSNGDVSRRSGIAAATIEKWRRPVSQGGTRFPQMFTLATVARAYGLEFKLVERSDAQASAEQRMHA